MPTPPQKKNKWCFPFVCPHQPSTRYQPHKVITWNQATQTSDGQRRRRRRERPFSSWRMAGAGCGSSRPTTAMRCRSLFPQAQRNKNRTGVGVAFVVAKGDQKGSVISMLRVPLKTHPLNSLNIIGFRPLLECVTHFQEGTGVCCYPFGGWLQGKTKHFGARTKSSFLSFCKKNWGVSCFGRVPSCFVVFKESQKQNHNFGRGRGLT